MLNVLVTGGSRGLGLGIAQRLAGAGYCSIAVARKPSDQLSAAIEEAERRKAGSIRFVAFDLSDIEGISGLVRGLKKEFGALYGLVNNAGIAFDGTLALMPDAQIAQQLRVNTLAPMILTKYVVRAMLASGGGRIVNIASIMGFTGYSGLAAYGATKASLIGFTRSLAREVGRMGVNVNAVAPGFVRTEMTQGLKGRAARADRAPQRAAPPARGRGRRAGGRVSARRRGQEHHRDRAHGRRRQYRVKGAGHAAPGTPSASKAWLRALELTAPIASHPRRTLPVVIDELAAIHGEAPALLSERDQLSYRALAERARRYARWALAQGLAKGDVVCLLMPNRPEYLAIWLGVTRSAESSRC